jgi:hypothetical protein
MLMVNTISHASFRLFSSVYGNQEYVIAIPAARYDLLCLEGFARAIRVFIGKEAVPIGAPLL